MENNKAYIEFTIVGMGEKEFGTVTLVLENQEGTKKALKMEFNYFLKEKTEP